ncbi:hypothetical protein L596_017776 [Steinernema carpocapsae]|uniref:Saposin B-type domain-containing protein n=1 Tax=Steinernema carpocapsae TaxID=34508 RepID=A0A4U5N2M3_STECR|nr:hypothetical protein L596_017776 [Steinernema carpocapsae]
MARFFFAAVLVGLVVLQIHADLAADLKPIMQVCKPTCVAIKKGCKAAATNVKAAVQNAGAACQQITNGGAKIAGVATVGAGKTVADAPEQFYEWIKQLEKKGPVATVLKNIFGPPPKKTSQKGGNEGGKERGKAASSEED